jgi:hypothetical protein
MSTAIPQFPCGNSELTRVMTPSGQTVLPDPAADKATGVNTELPAAARPEPAGPHSGQPGSWLHAAAAGLFLLAGAAAAVSFAAQYRLVYAARRLAAAAALEAAIPDAAALVFACLGVALALHGRRALRARLLNIASAAASVFMNLIAAAPGWRDLAVWAMPPTAYALASDTLIGVVRAGAVARHRATAGTAQDASVLAAAAGLALWLLRLALAPASTLAGFRAWVIEECPVAPSRRAARPAPVVPPHRAVVPPSGRVDPSSGRPPARVVRQAVPAGERSPRPAGSRPPGSGRPGTKTARFLALVTEQHGRLAAIPLASTARISARVAPQAGLNTGSARAALRRAVLAAQEGER